MSMGVVRIDAGGLIVGFDPGAEMILGHSADRVMGMPMAPIIIPEPLRAAHHDGMDRFLRTGEPFLIGRTIEITAQHANGSVLPVELTLTLESEDPLVIAGLLRHLDA